MQKEKPYKVKLSIMPFWSPLTPPMGIACLKSYLEQNGYSVRTKDYNAISSLFDFGGRYIALMKSYTPIDRMGNIAMVGYDVLMAHLIAYNNREDFSLNDYHELVRQLILNNFFYESSDEAIENLCELVEQFYALLAEYLINDIKERDFDVYGISCYSLTLGPSIFAFKFVKKHFPEVKTVMGGGIFADQFNSNSLELETFAQKATYIDYFLLGEGEIILLNLLESNFQDVPRIIVSDKTVKKVCLDDTTLPDFSDFDMNSYPQLVAYSSRSCPFQCGFCSETVQWGKYRNKREEKVVFELRSLTKKYGKNIIVLTDSLLNPNIDKLADALLEVPPEERFYWDTYLRVCDMAEDMEKVKKWRKAGLYRVRLGIESGSQHVLDLMDKRITIEKIKSNLQNLADAGLKISTFWVVGFPGETKEDFHETLDFLREIKDNLYEVDPHPFYFYPSGQVDSESWEKIYGYESIYEDKYNDMLMCTYYKLNCQPCREEIYRRLELFRERCEECNIPNPYSLIDIYHADKRWKKLHKAAVPLLNDLIHSGSAIVDEYRDSIVLE